ncbi:MAG: T9SS type A sorting domain-containing protein [Balneolales bacterium]|nr:T9SS type A sorting domain-containing protein [Balneolales bacterium]
MKNILKYKNSVYNWLIKSIVLGIACLGFISTMQAQGNEQDKTAISPWLEYWLDETAASGNDLLSIENQHSFSRPRCLTGKTVRYHRNSTMMTKRSESLFFKKPVVLASENSYQSPEGTFTIWYFTEGEHMVDLTDNSQSGIPDFIELLAFSADQAKNYYVHQSGYLSPASSDGSYSIFVRNLGFYGFTGLENGEPFSVIDSTFDWIPGNDAENERDGAARISVAHEIFHAIQYRYANWQGPFGETAWLEMDAVVAENAVFPEVNEYLNFLNEQSIFRTPAQGTPVAYAHASWFKYFDEAIQPAFTKYLWERAAQNPEIRVENLVHEELESRGLSYHNEIVNLHLWHLASGTWSRPGFGFGQASRYPTSFKRSLRTTLPTAPYPLWSVAANAANYYAIVPEANSGLSGEILAAFFRNSAKSLVGIAAYFQDGSIQTYIPELSQPETVHPRYLNTLWNWEQVEQLGIVVVNASPVNSIIHQLLIARPGTTEQIKWGDVTGNGNIREEDALRTLAEITGSSETILSFDRAFAADVSGNTYISAFDAALILRKSSGFQTSFPADLNDTGMGPELSRFPGFDARSQNMPPAAAAQSAPIVIRLLAEPLQQGSESTVEIQVLDIPEQMISGELEIAYSSNILRFDALSSAGSVFGELIRDTYQPEPGIIRLVWASNMFAQEGIAATIVFNQLQQGTAEVIPLSARINEFENVSYELLPVTYEAEPQPPVSVYPHSSQAERPVETGISGIYPNPFNPVTQLRFSLAENSEVSLWVYNALGQRVAQLINGQKMTAGEHAAVWSGSNFSSGVYFFVLEIQNNEPGNKLIRHISPATLLK